MEKEIRMEDRLQMLLEYKGYSITEDAIPTRTNLKGQDIVWESKSGEITTPDYLMNLSALMELTRDILNDLGDDVPVFKSTIEKAWLELITGEESKSRCTNRLVTELSDCLLVLSERKLH